MDEVGQHIFIPGASGTGKTTTLVRLADGALANGFGVIIVDCKGVGLGGEARRLAARWGVPYVIVDPDDADTVGYDVCSGDPAGVANKIIGAFEFSGDAEIYKQVAMEVVPLIARALSDSGAPITLDAIYGALGKGGLSQLGRRRGAERYRDRMEELEAAGGITTAGYTGLQRRLGALMQGKFGDVFEMDPALDWDKATAAAQVTYLSLSSTATGEDVELFGRVITQDLKQLCDRRMRAIDRGQDPTPVLVIYDEFAALREATQVVDLLLQARQARAPIVVATQFLPDEVSIRKPVLSAGVIIAHRLGHDDAEQIAKELGTHKVPFTTAQVDYESGMSEKGSVRMVDEFNVHPNVLRTKKPAAKKTAPTAEATIPEPASPPYESPLQPTTVMGGARATTPGPPPAPVRHLPSPKEPRSGIPATLTRFQWLNSGFGRQVPATVAALLAGWTGLILALWAAAIGGILGALIAVGLIATNRFTRSLFHAGAGEALSFLGIGAGALAGIGGSFTAVYATSLFGNPTRLRVTLISGLILSVLIVVVISFIEPQLLRARAYRQLTTGEARRVAPLVYQVETKLGLRSLPLFAMAEVSVPNAWTHTRTVVLTTGLLDTLDDDAELRAVIAHELHHWIVGDAVGLRLVWACAWPIAVAYNAGVCLSGIDLSNEKPQRLPRSWVGWIGWFLLWPTWLLSNAVIAPLVAMRQRKHEFDADAAAARIGEAAALSSALEKMSAFEAGRTGWEYAMTRHHPSTALRRERLAPARPDDDEYRQEPLGQVPKSAVAYAALALVAVLIVFGAAINRNRATAKAQVRVPQPGQTNQVPPTTDSNVPVAPPTTPTTAPPTTAPLPSVPSATAGFADSQDGAGQAAKSFTTALAGSLFDHCRQLALLQASGGSGQADTLANEVDTVCASPEPRSPVAPRSPPPTRPSPSSPTHPIPATTEPSSTRR